MIKVQIAPGNSKIGKLPAISLPPCKACRPDAPCKKTCYAMKAWRQYPETRAAWSRNLKLANNRPFGYFDQIHTYLQKRRPRFFRWHVSGDILSQSYLNAMCGLAAANPQTKFLCFTKQYELDYSGRPDNLTIVFSAWPNFPLPYRHVQPIAWMYDASDPDNRIPWGSDSLRECPGHCDSCGMCWSLKRGESVVFHKH